MREPRVFFERPQDGKFRLGGWKERLFATLLTVFRTFVLVGFGRVFRLGAFH